MQLAPEHKEIIAQKVASGQYGSPDEVLSVALQWLDERDLLLEYRREKLRDAITVADEQAAAGRVRPFDAKEMTARVRAALKTRQASPPNGSTGDSMAE